jgi:regulator of replication initiation timing
MGSSLLVRPDLGAISQLEQRLVHLEALIKEMRAELNGLKVQLTEEDLIRLEKMKAYQRLADQMLNVSAKA